jgi:tRNA pseudouridine55 synthase
MHGIFIIDKPEGMTSHDVVQAIRKKFKTSKVGHHGTLDPMATGVLPVAIGKATRVLQFISSSPKEYEGELRFGFATDTYDRQGVATTGEQTIQGNLDEAMKAFIGTIEQTPPPFSAKKVGGVPAYKLARRNQSIPLASVRVEIKNFDLLKLNDPFMSFRVACSPGTYIRSLAHDLGQRLGCGAHLTALRRTRSGEFEIKNAVDFDKVSSGHLIPLHELLASIPRIDVSETEEVKIVHGNSVRDDTIGPSAPEFARIFNKRGEFVAVASVENGWVHPRLVLTSINSD